MFTKLYVYACNRMWEKCQQTNANGAVVAILIVLAVLAYFTFTSPKFHGIHFKHG